MNSSLSTRNVRFLKNKELTLHFAKDELYFLNRIKKIGDDSYRTLYGLNNHDVTTIIYCTMN